MSYGLDPDEAGRKGIYKLGNFLQDHRKNNINVALIPPGRGRPRTRPGPPETAGFRAAAGREPARP